MRFLILILILSVDLVIATTFLLLRTSDLDVSELLKTLSVHVVDIETVDLENPTLGKAKWKMVYLREQTGENLVFTFIGDVVNSQDDLYMLLVDSNEDYPHESALSLRWVYGNFDDVVNTFSVIVLTDRELKVEVLRRFAWRGVNILVLPKNGLKSLIIGIRGEADGNSDGKVSFGELLSFLRNEFGDRMIGFCVKDFVLSESESELLKMAYSRVLDLVRRKKLDVDTALAILKITLVGKWHETYPIMEFGLGKMGLSDLLKTLEIEKTAP